MGKKWILNINATHIQESSLYMNTPWNYKYYTTFDF